RRGEDALRPPGQVADLKPRLPRHLFRDQSPSPAARLDPDGARLGPGRQTQQPNDERLLGPPSVEGRLFHPLKEEGQLFSQVPVQIGMRAEAADGEIAPPLVLHGDPSPSPLIAWRTSISSRAMSTARLNSFFLTSPALTSASMTDTARPSLV